MRIELDAQVVRELISYHPETGELTWKLRDRKWFNRDRDWKTWNTRYANTPAMVALNGNGYHHGSLLGASLLAHRVGWCIHYGVDPGKYLDHRNGKRSDNRIRNLRQVTNAENGMNQKRRSDNVSGVKGVRWNPEKKRWHARIWENGRIHHLGYFADIQQAAQAYAVGAEKYHGQFQRAS